ncbi:thioredoxin family protein [Mycoplasma sp. 744]|uniref:thioredoxin family protein n=1 Tax=Mycoplasma sp. 744 TaxID=3108531 RepID=UPI002B1E5C90|nr:thioredoxin family protein [Mycoplasma sp. 744]MEA4115591.1 thioredoxin family protein [Mycoplasma sp. 744]
MKKISFNELKEILERKDYAKKLFFLVFTTSWCNDCKIMKPIIKELYEDYKTRDDVIFLEIDAEEANLYKNASSNWEIFKVPSFVYYKNNKILKILYEYYPKNILSKYIEDYTD